MKKITSYDIIITVIMILFIVLCMAPLVLMLSSSLTDNNALIQNGYSFFPSKWSGEAYRYIVNRGSTILTAYGMSLIVTGVGTLISMVCTTTLAYAISKKELPGRGLLTFFVFFTMLFNGGLVPTYLMYTNTFNLKNTIWALILPSLLVRAFHVMLMRSFFITNIPGEVLEAASIDGASEFKVFSSIVLPMSKPILATVLLFQLIMYWNDWQNGLYYISTKTSLYTIQNLLNRMMLEIQYLASATAAEVTDTGSMPTVSVRMAIAVIGILPITIIYPFIQKYFVKGIAIGAVKG